MVVRRNACSEQGHPPTGSWSSRIFTAGALLAIIGFFVKTWGEAGTQAQRSANEILGQPPPGVDPATVVGIVMLVVGILLVVTGLLIWVTKKLTG